MRSVQSDCKQEVVMSDETQKQKVTDLHDKVEGVSEELAACLANALELGELGLADRLRKAQQVLSRAGRS